MIPRRRLFHMIILGSLLLLLRLAWEISSAVSYVCKDASVVLSEFGAATFWLTGPVLLYVCAAAAARLFKGFLAECLVLLLLCTIPFLTPTFTNPRYWKFSSNRASYLARIEMARYFAPDRPELWRYFVFDWGTRDAGTTWEAIVYDESGDIARSYEIRSSDWFGRRWQGAPWWIAGIRADRPDCNRHIESYGGDFYHVIDAC